MIYCIKTFFLILTYLAFTKANSFQADLSKLLLSGAYEDNISSTCQEQLKLLGSSLGSFNQETAWAWKMVDATAKIQSGILEGNNFASGAFDECMDIVTNTTIGDIRGKYCLGNLLFKISTNLDKKPIINTEDVLSVRKHLRGGEITSFPSWFWGGCIPNGCTGEEVAQVYNDFLNNYLDGIVNLGLSEALCQTVEDVHKRLDNEAIIAVTIFAITLGFMIFSTIYDIYLYYSKSEPAHIILISFSALTNGKKLFKVNKNNPDLLPCLNGLRVISMFWIILGHQYSNMTYFGLFNRIQAAKWMNSLYSMYISNANLSVDTFFLLAGLLMTYGFFKALEKGVHFNVFMFWLHRYLRLTPALAAFVLMSATLSKYLGSGPLWPLMEASDNCKTYWWSALLYIQNWVNVDEICAGHSWYLSVDMQLFILSPLVLIPLSKWKKLGIGLLTLLILISIAIPFAVAWINDLHSMFDISEHTIEYERKYYYMTHTRATAWLIGILVGYCIVHLKKNKNIFKPSKIVVCFLWAASLSLLISCVFSGHSTLHGATEYDKWAHVSYITFLRPTWSIALSWVILACVTGYGGSINSLLSFRIYQILGRLTYSMYLLHMTVIHVKVLSTRESFGFRDTDAIFNFWGTTIFTAAFSIVWVLAFESPMITIEKVLFQKSGKPKLENKFEEAEKKTENC